jgi:hypothetical protein
MELAEGCFESISNLERTTRYHKRASVPCEGAGLSHSARRHGKASQPSPQAVARLKTYQGSLRQRDANGRMVRWSRFLRLVLQLRDNPVPDFPNVQQLDKQIWQQKNPRRKYLDNRKAIYRQIKMTHAIEWKNAWYTGEALHSLGLTWCSGLLCLHAAGHLSEFAQIFAVANPQVLRENAAQVQSMVRLVNGLVCVSYPDLNPPSEQQKEDWGQTLAWIRARDAWTLKDDMIAAFRDAFETLRRRNNGYVFQRFIGAASSFATDLSFTIEERIDFLSYILEQWLRSDVLPTFHETGIYVVEQSRSDDISNARVEINELLTINRTTGSDYSD